MGNGRARSDGLRGIRQGLQVVSMGLETVGSRLPVII